MHSGNRRKRRRGFRLDDYVVGRLPTRSKQYVVWDLAVEGCGVRISGSARSCVISVRVGQVKKFETIGRITPTSPYEYLRELAVKRIGELKRGRLSRGTTNAATAGDSETLKQALDNYIVAHPELGPKTPTQYRKRLQRAMPLCMDQPISLLVAPEILRINQEHLQLLAKNDPVNRPPIGFWSWQATLSVLRVVVCWRAAQKQRPNPWPDRRALRIKNAAARELPVELQSHAGRKLLIEGLRALDTPMARAVRFIAYTGLRRRAAAGLTLSHLIAPGVLEFHSKTRMVRIPLSKQAAELLEPDGNGRLLHAGDKEIGKALIRIFGTRHTPRGNRSRVTPHDLRRYFKSVGTELGIDPTIMNLLVGHTVKGVDKHYIAKLRLSVLRNAAQRIADEIDNPQLHGEDEVEAVAEITRPNVNVERFDAYLRAEDWPSLSTLAPKRHAHYLRREDLHRLVWTAPVTEVAARFGLSDVGLAKTCRRARIPLPGRGYWASVEAGRHVPVPELPEAPEGLPELIRVRGTQRAPSAERIAA